MRQTRQFPSSVSPQAGEHSISERTNHGSHGSADLLSIQHHPSPIREIRVIRGQLPVLGESRNAKPADLCFVPMPPRSAIVAPPYDRAAQNPEILQLLVGTPTHAAKPQYLPTPPTAHPWRPWRSRRARQIWPPPALANLARLANLVAAKPPRRLSPVS